MLKILVIIDISGFFPGNAFASDYVKALSMQPGCQVYVGKHWLTSTDISWDVVNIHWPEHLITHENDLNEFNWLKKRLVLLSKSSKVITTIHNLRPHDQCVEKSTPFDIFQLVYDYSSAFVHLAEASIKLLVEQYPRETANKIHHVIPHGNYRSLENMFGYLPICDQISLANSNKIKVLSIGAIRSLKELKLLASACFITGEMGGIFYNYSTLQLKKTPLHPFHPGKIISRFFDESKDLLIKKLLPIVTGVPFEDNFIPNSKMSELLCSCDVVFLPRASSLNSGNIPLAFTYGCVVVGPDIGNIGLILKQSGNPVYNITNFHSSIRSAIGKCFDVSTLNITSKNNKDIALRKWDWSLIAKNYISLFREVAGVV